MDPDSIILRVGNREVLSVGTQGIPLLAVDPIEDYRHVLCDANGRVLTHDDEAREQIAALTARVQVLEGKLESNGRMIELLARGLEPVANNDRPPIEDLVAASNFRDALILRADDPVRLMWHGWALTDAFLAGIAFAKESKQ